MKAAKLPVSKPDFRQRVRLAMRVRGITYEQLGARLGVKNNGIKASLHYHGGPTASTIARYAQALAVTKEFLRGEENLRAELVAD